MAEVKTSLPLREWINRFIEEHPSEGRILKLDVEFGNPLLTSLLKSDGEDGPMMALGMSLGLMHAAKWGLPADLSEWMVEV